jgi:hypothetical protein
MIRFPIILTNSAIPTPHIPVPKEYRNLFPPYQVEFILETNQGDVATYMTSAATSLNPGDGDGKYFSRGMTEVVRRLPKLRAGDQVFIEIVVPRKRYKFCC